MGMSDKFWHEIAPSEFEWERRALKFLRENLPDRYPYSVWTNFEFIAQDGAIFEVDALVFSKAGVFLVEIKSHRGHMQMGPRTWVHTRTNKQIHAIDNPLYLANKKAKLLKSVLAEEMKHARVPFISAVVFMSEPELVVDARDRGANGVFFHSDKKGSPSILDGVLDGKGPGIRRAHTDLNKEALKRFKLALEKAGIQPSEKSKRYGDYTLTELLDVGQHRQDWLAVHRSSKSVRRARIFYTPSNITDEHLARLQQAAKREFETLESLRHPNILAVKQHVNYEQRPGLLFEHPEGAVRLDHYVNSGALSVETKFDLLLQTCEAIQYAHRKRVVHRALSPQSILVLPGDGAGPEVRVLNWHTSRRAAAEETGTRHLTDYLDDQSQVYLAPELNDGGEAEETADVYGLGAIAFSLFAEQSPAESLEGLLDVLIRQQGLRISTVADNVPPELDDLIYQATRTKVPERLQSVSDLIQRLQSSKAKMVKTRETCIDPLTAEPGEWIDDRFQILGRIGSGSSATALLARNAEDNEVVLKVANDDSRNELLSEESVALAKLDHPLIVKLFEVTKLRGRTTLVLQSAGTPLSERLRKGALSLDEVRRFGEDLCEILVAIEEQRVFHRDIKPANLGIGTPHGEKTRQRLMLFDFSLAGVSLEAYEVGTPIYRDPFLRETKRRRWDEYADRYSGSITLYEMITGKLPEWGDGRTNPVLDPSATLVLESHFFPASIRDKLNGFFEQSLAREVSDRFDHAEEMLRAWRTIFEATVQTSHGGIEKAVIEATPLTRISELGISEAAVDALDRLNIITLADLLKANPSKLQFLKGTSGKVRKEITGLRDLAVEMLPAVGEQTQPNDLLDPARLSVDQLYKRISGELPKGITDPDFMKHLLMEVAWPTSKIAAEKLGAENYEELAKSWQRKQAMKPLCLDISMMVENAGGALSDRELARAVLGLRGSLLESSEERIRVARCVSWAAVEAELADPESRFQLVRLNSGRVFVVSRPEVGDLIPLLGSRASELVAEETITPSRAISELSSVATEAEVGLAPNRLLALATEASENAALSSRNELYLIGLAPLEVLKLATGVLISAAEISPAEIQDRVAARYPEASTLPSHPELQPLLKKAGFNFKWESELRDGYGAYVNEDLSGPLITRSTMATAFTSGTMLPATERLNIRDQFRERIEHKLEYGGFLALMADPRYLETAERRLLADHSELERYSLDEAFIRHLREQTAKENIEWSAILRSDAPSASPDDQRRLLGFIQKVIIPTIEAELKALRGNLLVVHPGLLGHFDNAGAMDMMERVHQVCGTADGPRLICLLIASDRMRNVPAVDGVIVPTLHSSEYARVPLE